jgi:hypothetical protein
MINAYLVRDWLSIIHFQQPEWPSSILTFRAGTSGPRPAGLVTSFSCMQYPCASLAREGARH